MQGKLARKRPATIVHRIENAPALPRHETIVRPTRQEVMKELQRMASRHEIGSTYLLKPIQGGWALGVVRIAERRRRFGLKLGLWVVGTLVALGALVLLLRALVPLLPYVLVGAVVVAGLARVAKPAIISVVQSVVIKR